MPANAPGEDVRFACYDDGHANHLPATIVDLTTVNAEDRSETRGPRAPCMRIVPHEMPSCPAVAGGALPVGSSADAPIPVLCCSASCRAVRFTRSAVPPVRREGAHRGPQNGPNAPALTSLLEGEPWREKRLFYYEKAVEERSSRVPFDVPLDPSPPMANKRMFMGGGRQCKGENGGCGEITKPVRRAASRGMLRRRVSCNDWT